MDAAPPPVALLLTDLVGSAELAEQLGDEAMAGVWAAHDRLARDLLRRWRGHEIDKTDGFLLLFADAHDALGYVLAYHRALSTMAVPLAARAGLHVGQLTLRENPAEDVALGAKPFEAGELTRWALDLGDQLRSSIRDTTYLLHDLLGSGRRVLFEGANAALLDVDHGTYPFVTSSSTTVLGIPAGTGIPGARIDNVIGVVKAYSTRVGNGPLPTEQINEVGERIRQRGREFGTTTGRPRRVGWLDLVAVRYSALLNGVSSLSVMLLDVLAGLDELRVCTAYRLKNGQTTDRFVPDADWIYDAEPVYQNLPGFPEEIQNARRRADLPANARAYLDLIERTVGVPISIVSVGPDRAQTLLE